MKQRKINNRDGIALGPILFIIAILAVIAAAIAAGSSGFNANTNTENVKTMAETIIQQMQAIRDGTQRAILENSCDVTQLDFSPLLGANANAPSNGTCNIFKPSGGAIGAVPAVPSAATTTGTNTYEINDGGSTCSGITNLGIPTNQQIFIRIENVTNAVCAEFNVLVGMSSATHANWDGYFATFAFNGVMNDNIGSCGTAPVTYFPVCLTYGAGTLNSIYSLLVNR